MKTLTTFLIVLFCFSKLSATAQIPDKIIYEGKEYALFTNPLEVYFSMHPDKRPESDLMSTALWRGYIASFELIDGQLFVTDIEIEVWNEEAKEAAMKSVIDDVFPDLADRTINWFSGMLTIPYGNMVSYIHMGYESLYENYILIQIKNGKFIKSVDIGYEEYIDFDVIDFLSYKKTVVLNESTVFS